MIFCSKFLASGTARSLQLCHMTRSYTKVSISTPNSANSFVPRLISGRPARPLSTDSALLPGRLATPHANKPLSCSVCRQQLASLGLLSSQFGHSNSTSRHFTPPTATSFHCAALSSGAGDGGGNVPSDDSDDGRGGSGGVESILGAAGAIKPPFGEEVLLLDVTGMRCAGCVSRVRSILEEQPTVRQASVNLATETAVVRVTVPQDGATTASAVLKTAPPMASQSTNEEIDIEAGIPIHEQRLTAMGTSLAKLLTGKGYAATLRPRDGGTGSSAKVVAAKRAERMSRLRDATRRLAVAWLLASGCMAHHIVHWLGVGAPVWLHHFISSTPLHAALSALAILGPGRQIVVDGFKALARNAPDMNSLVGLGATAAYGISAVAAAMPHLGWPTFFEEPAMLLGVVLIGRALEERAKLQASADMAALQGLLPQKARLLLSDGVSWREVPAETITAGDRVEVLPGDRVPVDGVVVGGKSSVDESGMTGEPLPVNKLEGDHVAAGSLNYDGRLTVQATHSGGDTAVADVVRLVETAQARSAPIQRVADEVAGKFTYGVMGAAATAFLFWIGPGTHLFPHVLTPLTATTTKAAASLLLSLQMACNVLVVACPCALGLAAPTAVLVGTSAGARRGLLVRGGDVLEAASHIDTVVFDKTGTLTMGRPTVVTTRLAGSEEDGNSSKKRAKWDEKTIITFAGAVERGSTHPIAKAICRAADGASQSTSSLQVKEGTFIQEPGSGVSGVVNGHKVYVGTLEWVHSSIAQHKTEQAISGNGNGNGALHVEQLSPASTAGFDIHNNSSTRPGHILVHVGIDGHLAGSIEISDELRPDAADTVKALKRAGIRPVMLSGDQPATAQAIADSVGIDAGSVYAGVKPAGKADLIEKLQSKGRNVAMVGDGVNDAAALARANVGIAMGGGVDAASEVADIVLLGDKVPQVLDALRLSRATMTTIKQNMWWAFAYNLACIPVAAGALMPGYGIALTPSMSGAMMGVSSLAVMANSLMLQYRIDSGQLQTRKKAAGNKKPVDGTPPQSADGNKPVTSAV